MERPTITPTIKPSVKQYKAYQMLWNDFVSFVLYGGAAGGGKSWLGCEWLLTNCYNYPGSRWFIGRDELKRLMTTSYITWQKVCRWHKIPDSDWKLNGQYNYIEFVSGAAKGSRIDLLDLSYKPSDPLYERLGSLEFTGGWIEEAEEVEFLCFDILKTRVGRFMNTEFGLFPAKMLLTCNPTDGWLYRIFYKPFKENTLPQDHAFIKALYSDNPHTKEEYGKQLDKISDPLARARLRDGLWEYAGGTLSIINLDAIIDIFTNPIATGDMQGRMTADIARFGGDKMVAGCWRGLDLYRIVEKEKQGLNKTCEDLRSLSVKNQIPYSSIVVDEDGVGGGVVDHMEGIHGFMGGRSPILKPDEDVDNIEKRYQNLPSTYLKRQNYKNLRSQCYFLAGELINNRQMSISAEDLTEVQKQTIIEELQQVKREDTSASAPLQIVPKEKMKEALGHSPDFADMIMMRMYFELLKESPPEGVYNEPDEEVLRELGIENKFGGTEGYGIESFGLKAN